MSTNPPKVKTGLDVLREKSFSNIMGRRVGLLIHTASVASDLSHIIDLVIEAGVDVRVVLGPEHGVGGGAQDMHAVKDESYRPLGIPTISLYGDKEESLRPPPQVLDEIDVLLVDLQDVGSRYYTYAATLRYCMEACAQHGVHVVVLDRPNPINGLTVEGPVIGAEDFSFVGAFAVPIRHGLTIGELATQVQWEGLDVELLVVRLQGWNRAMWFDDTGLPWIMPSPNMPTQDTTVVYPGACLVEATNLSEGRGTTRPFELLGAPWLDGGKLAADLNEGGVPGARCRSVVFIPTHHKHQGVPCRGIQVHVTDRHVFSPVAFGLRFLEAAHAQAPHKFSWRKEPYEFVADKLAVDLLLGRSDIRDALHASALPRDLSSLWLPELADYREKRRSYLLYPENEG